MIHVPTEGRSARAPQLLTERGITPSAAAAAHAAAQNDVLILKLLRDSGVGLEAGDADGVTPLIAAARADAGEVLHWLTRRQRVSLETPDAAGMTAMAHAIEQGHLDSAEWLAREGAYPGAFGRGGRSPIAVAASRGDLPMLDLLFELGERQGLGTALRDAMLRDDLGTADQLLAHSNAHPTSGSTTLKFELLDEAIREGLGERVALFLRHGVPTDSPNAEGLTPLGLALTHSQNNIAEQLLSSGVSVEAACSGSLTPLEFVWSKRDRETAGFLLEQGAAPHPGIFLEAAEAGEFGFVSLLADYGTPIDIAVGSGESLLAQALSDEDHSLADRLLQLGASPDTMGKEEQPLLAIATARGDAKAVQLLLAAGADPNVQLASPTSDAFLELAGSKTLTYYMKRDSRFTPLMVAAATGHGDTIRALLAGGASRSKYTRSWKRYPISFASSANNILAQQLISGYDPEKREDLFKIVIDLSSQRATLYKNDKAVNSSTVSTGKAGYRTPTGEYVVTHKHKDHKSSIYNSAPMPYFMRFSCSAFGTHTGYCPGYPASHGCIRMPNSKAREFFYAAPTGTPVSIVK